MTRNSMESLKRAIATGLVMPGCEVCIIVVTKGYIMDYQSGDPEIVTQVRLSRQLQQDVVLLVDQEMTPNELAQVKHMFKSHHVVARITFDSKNFRRSMPALYKALKPYR